MNHVVGLANSERVALLLLSIAAFCLPHNAAVALSRSSHTNVTASTEQAYEPEILETPSAYTSWTSMLVLAASAALQTKAAMIWSESRILRKLRSPLQTNIGKELEKTEPRERFAELVFKLAKGRQNRFSRSYDSLFQFFIISTTSWAWSDQSIWDSDAYLALVLLIVFGSFTVLGARPLSWFETALALILCIGYGVMLYLSGVGTIYVDSETKAVLSGMSWLLVAVDFVWVLFDVVKNWRCRGDDMFCIANRIMKKRELTARQERRLKEMEALLGQANHTRGLKGGGYWNPGLRSFIDVGIFFSVLLVNMMLISNAYDHGNVARILVPEVLELASFILLWFNTTQVEPTLFMELLIRAHDVDGVP